MVKTNVLILDKYLDEVTRALGAAGLVHLVDAVSQSKEHLLFGVDRQEDIADVEKLLHRIAYVTERLGIDAHSAPLPLQGFSKDAMGQTLDRVEAEIEAEEEAINTLLNESGMLDQEVRRLSEYPFQHTRVGALRDLSHLYIITGRVAPSLLPSLGQKIEDRALLLHQPAEYRNDSLLFVLTTRRNRWGVESDLKTLGVTPAEVSQEISDSPAQAREALENRLHQLKAEIETHRENLVNLHRCNGGALATMQQQLNNALAVARAQQKFGKSTHLYCISGWLPDNQADEVAQLVDNVTSGTAVVEMVRPQDDERVQVGNEIVPVKFMPNPILKPFQQLVTNFGAPRYGDMDPSLFVALSFVLMFGIMFGDLGQGAVVVALGLWLRRTRNPALTAFRDGGTLLVFCGVSAMIFGLLYGSVFGYENEAFMKPLWLSPIHDVTRLLICAVGFGVIAISVGIVMNILNKMRTGHYFEGVFDRFGVIGIIFYWGALGIGLKAAKAGELNPTQAIIVIVVPLALLFIREPLHNVLRHRDPFRGGLVNILVEACVETMETLTAFLGGTVSFVRIGVMALSHACLCFVTYVIADTLHDLPLGGVWSLLVVVLGNIVIIVLEGMIAMVQAIRLEYYELFSKYFSGDGVMYAPFRISHVPVENTQQEGDTTR